MTTKGEETIYNTLGLTSAGILSVEQLLRVLSQGPCYRQVVLKSEAAVAHLTWLEAHRISAEEIAANRALVREEEAKFQAAMANILED